MGYTIKEYVELAQRTSPAPEKEKKLGNARLGLIGESGEVADVVKKWHYMGMKDDMAIVKLIEECGDVLWYVAEYATAKDIDPDDLECRVNISHTRVENTYPSLDLEAQAVVLAQKCSTIHFAAPDLAKIIYMVDVILEGIGSTRAKCMEINIEKLKARYPEGFDAQKSNKRYERKEPDGN